MKPGLKKAHSRLLLIEPKYPRLVLGLYWNPIKADLG